MAYKLFRIILILPIAIFVAILFERFLAVSVGWPVRFQSPLNLEAFVALGALFLAFLPPPKLDEES